MTLAEEHETFQRTFQPQNLTLGLIVPFDNATHDAYAFATQARLASLADDVGFSSLFVRDNPLYSPHLGDVTTNYDPFVFLTYLSTHTTNIALGTSSIVATLRHPIHLAKATTSLDLISNERLLLGMATGDRKFEFPAFDIDSDQLSTTFQQTIESLQSMWQSHSPHIDNDLFSLYEESGLQVLPKHRHIPMFATGYAQQTMTWIKKHMDGWMFYPQAFQQQKALLAEWHDSTHFKPFMHPLAIDLDSNPNALLKPIKGGYHLGRNTLLQMLKQYEKIGTNHIMLHFVNYNRTYEDMILEIGEHVIPYFLPHSIQEEHKHGIIR
ncbi:LLM class oxidoreductase [Staphylococcus arlettae]|uniref:LLM class oxidoreductase n=1 Tax=Staphylococcus arlettae TaxID=29378 RepID=UPI001E5A5F98|nr:LLM class oxidoreductase [Staphylococcus arlettae]